MHPRDVSERLEVLRKLGWPGYDGHSSTMDGRKLNAVVEELIRWRHERQRPRFWHYAIKFWRLLWR